MANGIVMPTQALTEELTFSNEVTYATSLVTEKIDNNIVKVGNIVFLQLDFQMKSYSGQQTIATVARPPKKTIYTNAVIWGTGSNYKADVPIRIGTDGYVVIYSSASQTEYTCYAVYAI